MRHWDNLWSFNTSRFCVTCDATPEYTDPADAFCFDDDIEAVRSGAVDWFVARVRVTMDGREIGADYLGGCAYARASDFVKGDNRDGYFRDMVRQALQEARATLAAAPKMRAMEGAAP
jgi:hypothetical protein